MGGQGQYQSSANNEPQQRQTELSGAINEATSLMIETEALVRHMMRRVMPMPPNGAESSRVSPVATTYNEQVSALASRVGIINELLRDLSQKI